MLFLSPTMHSTSTYVINYVSFQNEKLLVHKIIRRDKKVMKKVYNHPQCITILLSSLKVEVLLYLFVSTDVIILIRI